MLGLLLKICDAQQMYVALCPRRLGWVCSFP